WLIHYRGLQKYRPEGPDCGHLQRPPSDPDSEHPKPRYKNHSRARLISVTSEDTAPEDPKLTFDTVTKSATRSSKGSPERGSRGKSSTRPSVTADTLSPRSGARSRKDSHAATFIAFPRSSACASASNPEEGSRKP